MTTSESSMAMVLSKSAMKNVEAMALSIARQTITECAALYGFSAEEAADRLGASTITLRTEEKVKKPKTQVKAIKAAFPLPFSGVVVDDCCQGVKANRGLYSQCAKACKKDSHFCTGCAKQCEKNASGEPDCGLISKRASEGDSWRDPKGRAPISFAKLMKKLKLTEDQVLAEAERLNVAFDAEKHFATEPAKETKRGRPKKAITSDTDSDSAPKKRGRPKKEPKTLEVSASEDLFATLVENAKAAAPQQSADMSDLSGSDSDSDTGSKKKSSKKSKMTEEEKTAKAEAKAAAKAEKEAKEAQEKAEKKATRDAEKAAAKAEKEAKEAEEKAEKKAARDAEKAKAKAEKEAKEAKEKAEKAAAQAAKAESKPAKAPKKASKAEAVAPVDETEELEAEEPVVKVEKFEFKGVTYLKSGDGTMYDMETQEEIGVWNEKTQTIDECESEDEDSDSDSDEDEE